MTTTRNPLAAAWLAAGFFLAPHDAGAQARTQGLTVRAENPSVFERRDEVISVPWSTVRQGLPTATAERVRARELGSDREVVTQPYDADGNGQPDELLLLASFWPRETITFVIEAAAPVTKPSPRVFVMHQAERDDVAWESDRVGFRTYGQGLMKTSSPLSSSGIDVWPKRTRDLIVQKWYSVGHDAYHVDTAGTGADFFEVGPTLGAGGTAIWRDGKLYRSHNFRSYRILANGPIRAAFELVYDPWDAGGVRVSETKRFAIDAGQNLFRQESVYRFEGAPELTYAIGLVKRLSMVGATSRAEPWGWTAGWGPVHRKHGGHGLLGTAVMLDRARILDTKETDDHYIAIARAVPGQPLVHYVGAGWTASGDFPNVESWWAHLDQQARKLAAPIEVTVGSGATAGR